MTKSEYPPTANLSRQLDSAYRSIVRPVFLPEEVWHPQGLGGEITLIQRAMLAREHAISYRPVPFKVGAAALAFALNPGTVINTAGANFKPDAGGEINIHAESLAVDSCRRLGADAVSLVCVVGDIQADQQSGRATDTLHPCGLCRQEFCDSPLIHPRRTMFVTATPHLVDDEERTRTVEWYNLEGLQRYHEEGDRSGITTVESKKRLKLLTPYKPAGTVVRLSDAEEETAEEEMVWRREVTIPMIDWRMRQAAEAA